MPPIKRVATSATPTDVAWLLTQSQAQRGRKVQAESTCASFAEWVQTCFGGSIGVRQLLRVPYPEPTPVTVVIGLSGNGAGGDAIIPKLFGFPWLVGTIPVDATEAAGTVIVSWICAGASFAVMVDLGANVVSIPACDQVTVEYFTHLPNSQPMISVAALPVYMPGAVATLTHVPVVVPAGGFALGAFRQQFTRRWKLTAAANPDPAPAVPPVAFGPLVVRMRDYGDTSETINFQPAAANGIPANQQGWIEASGPNLTQVVNNLGAVDVLARIVEQVQVS